MASPKNSVNRRKFSREPLDIDDLTSASSFSGIRDVIESHFGNADSAGGQLVLEADPTRLQYVWEPKDAPIAVRIDAELIERLERESLEIFRAITNRGSEIGGVLFGRVVPGTPLTVVIKDYEPVVCAYTLGPVFRLSDTEQQTLKDTLARRRDAGDLAVGFFRSNTRPTLAMAEEDIALFQAFFPEERNVFILAKPFSRKPCRGAIFFREGRKLRSESSHLEFSFSKAELEKSGELQPAMRVVRKEAGSARQSAQAAPPEAAKPAPRPPEPAAAPEVKPKVEPPAAESESTPRQPVRSAMPAALAARLEARFAAAAGSKVDVKVEPVVTPKAEPEPPPPPPQAKIQPEVKPAPEKPVRPVWRPKAFVTKTEPAPPSTPPPAPQARVEPEIKKAPEPEAPARPVWRPKPDVQPRVETPATPFVTPRVQFRPQIRPETPASKPAAPPPTTPSITVRPAIPRPTPPPPPPVEPPPPPPPVAEVSEATEPETAPADSYQDFHFGAEAEPQGGRRRWLLVAIILVVVAAIAAFLIFSGRSNKPAVQSKPAARTPAAAQPAPTLLLWAEGAEGGVMIHWDPAAPAIAAARAARLSIVDGGTPSLFRLSANELKKGSYIYKPRNDDLAIRLDLENQPAGQQAFGLTRVLGATRMVPAGSRR
jgi:hypothetical protein